MEKQDLMYRSIPSDGDERIRRVATAKRGLEAAYQNVATRDVYPTPEEKVVDMLADLRHLCQWLDLDYHAANDTAYQHYLEEKKEWTI